MTAPRHVELSAAHQLSSLGACRLYLPVITVSCCTPVMDPDRREDSGEMYSPDDQGEYMPLDETPHWRMLGKGLGRPQQKNTP